MNSFICIVKRAWKAGFTLCSQQESVRVLTGAKISASHAGSKENRTCMPMAQPVWRDRAKGTMKRNHARDGAKWPDGREGCGQGG